MAKRSVRRCLRRSSHWLTCTATIGPNSVDAINANSGTVICGILQTPCVAPGAYVGTPYAEVKIESGKMGQPRGWATRNAGVGL